MRLFSASLLQEGSPTVTDTQGLRPGSKTGAAGQRAHTLELLRASPHILTVI